MPGGAFDQAGPESETGMTHADQGRIDLLERALVEYIERYGMTDAAARAMRPAASCASEMPPHGKRLLPGLPRQMPWKSRSGLKAKQA